MAIRKLAGIAPVLAFLYTSAFATHLRCGEIQVKWISANTVEITVVVFTNIAGTEILFGGDQDRLDFGDGQSFSVPEQGNIPVEDLGGNIGMGKYTTRHTYASPGKYRITYSEPNRDGNIVNFSNAWSTLFYLETSITIDPFITEFSTPESFYTPIFFAYKDLPFSASIACPAAPGTELQYRIVTPLRAHDSSVENYQLPEGFQIDKTTGLITWDNLFRGSFVAGEYLFAVRIDQYKWINEKLARIGSVYRDFQITLRESIEAGAAITDNTESDHLDVFENATALVKIFTAFSEDETVEIQLATDLPEENFTYETYDSASTTGPIKVTRIDIATDASAVREFPYVISVRNKFEHGEQNFTSDINYAIYTTAYDPVLGNEQQTVKGRFSPNPATNFIQLHDLPDTGLSVELIDASGATKVMIANSENTIDISSLKPGLYMLRIRDMSGRIVTAEKLLKE